jgi:hypothetical protein
LEVILFCPRFTTAYLGVIVFCHEEKSFIPLCPVAGAFWYGFISLRSTETVQFVCVSSAAGAREDIPDTRILLSTGTVDLYREK